MDGGTAGHALAGQLAACARARAPDQAALAPLLLQLHLAAAEGAAHARGPRLRACVRARAPSEARPRTAGRPGRQRVRRPARPVWRQQGPCFDAPASPWLSRGGPRAGRATGVLGKAAAWLRHAYLRGHARRALQAQAAAAPGAAAGYVPVASALRSALALRPAPGRRPLLLVLARDALMLEGAAPGGGAAGAGPGPRAGAPLGGCGQALQDAHARVHKQQLGTLLAGLVAQARAAGDASL